MYNIIIVGTFISNNYYFKNETQFIKIRLMKITVES